MSTFRWVILSLLVALALHPNASAAVPTLSHCYNGTYSLPTPCTWSTGSASSLNSHWYEGESVPFRVEFTSLAPGTHSTTIQWSTTNVGKHAYDYLTSVDRTEASVDPCAGVAGCSNASYSTYPIPKDPMVGAFGVGQIDGSLRCYGCTVDSVGMYALSGAYPATSDTQVKIWFTSSASNPVLAWSNHVARVWEWNCASAQILSGSPYHGVLVDLDGASFLQDRPLNANAVVGPPCVRSTLSSATVLIGGSLTNTANLTDAQGTVRFYVCGPTISPAACSAGGQQVGGDQTLNGSTPVTSAPFSPAQTGYYSFRVEYTPPPFTLGPYSAGAYTDSTTEVFRYLAATGVAIVPASERIVAAPNPASSSVRLQVPTQGAERTRVRVVDVSGRLCRELSLQPGADRATGVWDLTDAKGKRVPSGLYFLSIVREQELPITRRVLVIR